MGGGNGGLGVFDSRRRPARQKDEGKIAKSPGGAGNSEKTRGQLDQSPENAKLGQKIARGWGGDSREKGGSLEKKSN